MLSTTENEFISLINAHIGMIHKICNVYFNGADDRKDGYQEIIYQLWKSYPGFKGTSKFSTWMYRVALNTAITYAKKDNRERAHSLEGQEWQQIADKSDHQEHQERMNLLYAAINLLSVTDKAITLLYLEDHSYEEMAEITGLTKSNISVRLVRIKRSLKEKLKTLFN